MIPYGRQEITDADVDAVVRILRSDLLTQGPAVPRFEETVARRVKARHAVAVNSGTSALHVACLSIGLGSGDLLWTVPNTFVASANCGRFCGADVDFVDIEAKTCNLDVEQLEEKLNRARRSGRLPKVLVPVHFAGQPTDQDRIWKLAKEFGFRVIEDASHAIGADHRAEPVGSCRWSDITVFSFHPVKIVTTAEGGMALTNDRELAERMTMFRSHGITRERSRWTMQQTEGRLQDAAEGAWYYEQQMLGYNYRMTDVQAALGISQLERLDSYVERRNTLAARYDRALEGLPLHLPYVRRENRSAFHLYVVRLTAEVLARKPYRWIFDDLRVRGIGVNLHYLPVHLQPYYRALGFSPGQYPRSEAHGSSAITLPLYAAMAEQQQDEVVAALKDVL